MSTPAPPDVVQQVIERLRAARCWRYPEANCRGCAVCLRHEAADTLERLRAERLEAITRAFEAGMAAVWNGKRWVFNPKCRIEGAVEEAFAAYLASLDASATETEPTR